MPARPQVTAGAACSPGYSPSSSQRPRRGRSRRPGAMVSRAPAVPVPCRALSPLETRWGRGLGRGRARPTAASTPAVEGGSWRAAPETGAAAGTGGEAPGMGLEGIQVLTPATLPKGRFPQLYPVVCSANSHLSCLRVVGTDSPAIASGQGMGTSGRMTRGNNAPWRNKVAFARSWCQIRVGQQSP